MPAEKKPNWDRIKAEYLKGGTSYRQLAAKHKVNESTLTKRAIRESWADELQQVSSEVAAEIRQQVVDSRIMDAKEVLERISNHARGGMGRVADWGPGGLILRPSEELDPEDLDLVFEVSETRNPQGGGSLRIKMADPLSALDKMMKHYGLYKGEGGGNGGGTGNPAEPSAAIGAADYSSMDPAELTQLYREACKAPGQVQE